MMFREKSPEVLVAAQSSVTVTRDDVEQVKALAFSSAKGRARICAHVDNSASVHEMVIAITRGSYIRPHKHLNKTESFHLIEGRLGIVVFDDQGRQTDYVQLGGFGTGLPFFFRSAGSLFHTVIVHSDVVVFHETTTGPFAPDETVFAPWSPEEGASEQVASFLIKLGHALQ